MFDGTSRRSNYLSVVLVGHRQKKIYENILMFATESQMHLFQQLQRSKDFTQPKVTNGGARRSGWDGFLLYHRLC